MSTFWLFFFSSSQHAGERSVLSAKFFRVSFRDVLRACARTRHSKTRSHTGVISYGYIYVEAHTHTLTHTLEKKSIIVQVVPTVLATCQLTLLPQHFLSLAQISLFFLNVQTKNFMNGQTSVGFFFLIVFFTPPEGNRKKWTRIFKKVV
jgi:hypothetical protein